jgi:NUMOD4 motif/HNH endonuclease
MRSQYSLLGKAMTEEWKSVLGFDGFYAVSNLGRVKSLSRVVHDKSGKPRRLPERIMTGTLKDNGYLHVSLRKPGRKQLKRLVHRLVATAFSPASGNEVNHIDGNKINNTVHNLEWCNHKDNMNHAWRNGFFAHRSERRRAR